MLDDAKMRRMTGHQHTDDARESTRKLTYADYVRFPSDGRRHELIDGVHVVSPTPILWHQTIVQRLSQDLGNYLDAHPLGWVWTAPVACVFSFFDAVEPDLLVVLKEQRGIVTRRSVRGAPAIVVEILSPSTEERDFGIKLALYEQNGVREYWIVDQEAQSVMVHTGAQRRFTKRVTYRSEGGDVLTTPLLPGFSEPLRHLFREW
jgi:Uma2 family endonuclease